MTKFVKVTWYVTWWFMVDGVPQPMGVVEAVDYWDAIGLTTSADNNIPRELGWMWELVDITIERR